MDIGFIGLGHMGAPIAANLLKAGHRMTLWNRSPDKAAALVAAGARLVETPAQAAQGDVVCTMLADDAAVEAVTFGPDGLLASGHPVLHIGMSTVGVAFADRLAAAHRDAGGAYLSAPVFGRPDAAQAARLSVVVAGEEERIAACEPLFAAIGQRVFRVGTRPSQANLVKLSGNFMILAAIEAMAEAMTLAQSGGIARETLLEVLTGTLFDAPVYRNYGAILASGAFRPAGFAAPLGLKDMRLAGEAAEEARVPMPTLALLRDQLLATLAQQGEDIDWSGIATAVASAAGRSA